MKNLLTFFAMSATLAGWAGNPYGACAHVTRGEPALRTGQMMRQAGLGWVRSDFDWSSIESSKGVWNFGYFDRVVGECEKAGVQLLPILGYSVPWANPAHEHLDEWGEYVRQIVTHYGKRLPVLEVWNEQNIEGFWKNPNPTNYLAVLKKTYEVAKGLDPKVRVAFGGTAGVPFEFIESVYALGGARYFDIMNIHPYSHPTAPEGREDANIDKLRNLMAKYGDEQKPLWITELGWPTHLRRLESGAVLRAGLRAADPAKRSWRTLYVPAQNDDTVMPMLQDALPLGSTCETCVGSELAARLAAGNVDAVVFPFSEDYSIEAVDAVVEFVKKGGVLVDFGGMPLWRGCRRDANGRYRFDKKYPSWDVRRRLRVVETAWWCDKRYPEKLFVHATEAAKGLKEPPRGFPAERFFKPDLLKAGDRLVPLLSAHTNGIEAVCAGVYRFNSDYRGAVIVNGYFENGLFGTSDEARQAKMMARALGIAFAEKVENFFWYEFRQPDANPYDPESYFGIVHDNFAPKPAFGAYMTFVDRRPAGSVQKEGVWRSADGTVYFPQWRRPDGKAAGMIWTTGTPRELRLEFSGADVRLLDAAGARVRPEREGKVFKVIVGDSPIYFTGAELRTDCFHTAMLSVEPGETPEEYLERIRAVAATARSRDPEAMIGAGGSRATDDFAKTFIGFGESEEIDLWQVAEPTPERVKRLRELFDGAGGKAVRLVDGAGKPLDAPAPKGEAKLEGKTSTPLLMAGTGRAYILGTDGKVSWERKGCGNIHQVQGHDGYVYYSNGDLWRCRLPGTQAELVYRPKERAGAGVLGFEVQPNGNIVVALNASGEVLELEAKSWRELTRFKVDVRNAKGETPGAHGRLRMIHKTAKGTYLVCCAGACRVREYDAAGGLVWEQEVPVMAFDCRRRANGNTFVSHITGVTEYTPDHQTVWTFKPEDLPELKLSCLCGIQETNDGNLVIGTWANGEPNGSKATAVEITRDRRPVWAWRPTGDRNMMTAVRMGN